LAIIQKIVILLQPLLIILLVGARTDAVTRTVQVEPAARLDTLAFDTTKYQSFSTEAGHTLTSAAKPIGPVRSKSAQCESY